MSTDGASDRQDARNAPSVLHNGIRVLRAFSIDDPTLGVTEIARRVGLHKSSVSRILGHLEQLDLVVRDVESGRFRLGLGVIGLAGPLLANLDVRRIAYPLLEELTERTHETSSLMVWSGNESISVEQVPSPRQVKHTAPIGTRYTTSASASVQVFLAEMTEERARALLEGGLGGREHSDEHTMRRYLDRLANARINGVAVNAGDTSVEEIGVSAPVRDHRGKITAAILLSAPSSRVSDDLLQQLSKAVRDTAQEVSARLGAAPSRS